MKANIRWFIIFCLFTLFSCDSNNFRETPMENFIGIWELEGRSMFNGIQVEISKSETGKYSGKVIRLNDNKYIRMFAEENDIWVSGIDRSSNFRFKLTERKIAAPLFAMYGQSSSKEFVVEFIDENSFGLASGGSDPLESSTIYRRVK